MWQSLRSLTNAYLAFLISFAVIGAYWRLHHRLYRYVGRLDSRLVSINLVWLLMIIITPYVTRVLEGPDAFGVRFSLYAGIQVITMVAFVLMRRHIRDHDLLRPGASANVVAADDISFIAVAAAFAISIPVAAASGSQLTYLIWVATAVGARAFRRMRDPLGERG